MSEPAPGLMVLKFSQVWVGSPGYMGMRRGALGKFALMSFSANRDL